MSEKIAVYGEFDLSQLAQPVQTMLGALGECDASLRPVLAKWVASVTDRGCGVSLSELNGVGGQVPKQMLVEFFGCVVDGLSEVERSALTQVARRWVM